MIAFTVEASEILSGQVGYNLLRSDGTDFILLWDNDSGHAVLFLRSELENSPLSGLVDFDSGIADKLGAARKWVLAYPEQPDLSPAVMDTSLSNLDNSSGMTTMGEAADAM